MTIQASQLEAGALVEVAWWDAAEEIAGDLQDAALTVCHSVGYYWGISEAEYQGKTCRAVVLSHHKYPTHEGQEGTGWLAIPHGWVIRITPVRMPEGVADA